MVVVTMNRIDDRNKEILINGIRGLKHCLNPLMLFGAVNGEGERRCY